MIRIGQGYAIRQLIENKELVLGGIKIPHKLGLLGYSGRDIVLHAIADAIVGAVAKQAINYFFPDTDDRYKDADSSQLLSVVWKEIQQQDGYQLGNLDCTIIAKTSNFSAYIEAMREHIAEILGADVEQVNIKITVSKLGGFIVPKEGIASLAVVLLEK